MQQVANSLVFTHLPGLTDRLVSQLIGLLTK